MYWNDLTPAERSALQCATWMGNPLVRAYINEQVSGRAEVWTVEWFGKQFAKDRPFPSGLVIGCGTGELERDLVRRGICERVVALDIAASSLALAREQAEREQLQARIEYRVQDGRAHLEKLPDRSLPAVFFHGALHHFDRIPELLSLVAAKLVPDGILFVDEYVGPSMKQWNLALLLPANLAYYLLPRTSRRPRLVRAPINPGDPSECICSAEILPNLHRYFEILVRRDYGGNLLSLVYPNLAPAPGSPFPADSAVRRLIRLERAFRRCTGFFRRTFHSVVVARPRGS
jgi:SAM-dependent methyltransferase